MVWNEAENAIAQNLTSDCSNFQTHTAGFNVTSLEDQRHKHNKTKNVK